MNNLHTLLQVAKKEVRDAVRSKLLGTMLLFLCLLIGISLVVATLDFQGKVSLYNKALEQLTGAGSLPSDLVKPDFYPLQLLRPAIEYLEIIGAILAILLGYISIAKEKGSGALALVLTRPVSRTSFILGKLLGNSFLISLICGVVFLLLYLAITLVGGVSLTSSEAAKLLLTALITPVYLYIFCALAVWLALALRSLPNALIASLVVWLLFVLIVPQIGDTMDPDNQVPGGLFASLHVAKPDQIEILKGFSSYETARNSLEEASLTKHYERLAFALLGIKDQYNGQPVGAIVQAKWFEPLWLFGAAAIFTILGWISFTRTKRLPNEDG